MPLVIIAKYCIHKVYRNLACLTLLLWRMDFLLKGPKLFLVIPQSKARDDSKS